VAGVYDSTAKKAYLYVNGKQMASVDAGTPWAAEGNTEIGRLMYADNYVDYFKGSVDEVTVWQRALTPKEVGDESRLLTSQSYAGLELVGDWQPAQGSGTTIADTTSGYGKSLTLEGGAALSDGDIVLDGVDDAATVTGPLVDGTGAFTVTTTVALDGAKLATKAVGYSGGVLSQQSTGGLSWGFWYQLTGKDTVLDDVTLEERTVPVGKWHFGSLNTDGTFSSVVSDEVAAFDSPVRLTGVYDSVAGTISLYMGHNQNGDAKAFTAVVGSGTFAVGKGYANSAWGHYLPARIGEVRLFAGAVAGSDQIDTYIGD
jgi:hypothetical protein